MELINGWLEGIRHQYSPNHDARDEAPSLVVVHCASLPLGEFGNGLMEKLFMDEIDAKTHPELAHWLVGRVSAHFWINREGEVTQFVSCDDRAWHAGRSSFEGREACNDFSIGIELEGCDHLPYTDAQYASLNAVLAALKVTYPINAVVGHEHIAPGRKTDPGPCFDWSRVS